MGRRGRGSGGGRRRRQQQLEVMRMLSFVALKPKGALRIYRTAFLFYYIT
jgi:hypothetical protein